MVNCRLLRVGKLDAYISPSTEPMLIISPDLRAAMCGMTALAMRSKAKTLVSKTAFVCSREWSISGAVKYYMSSKLPTPYNELLTNHEYSRIVHDDVDLALFLNYVLDGSVDGVFRGNIKSNGDDIRILAEIHRLDAP